MEFQKILNQLLKVVILGFVVLFPSFLLTNLASFFDFPKMLLLVTTVEICLIVWALKLTFDGKINLSVGNADIPLLLLLFAFVASAFLKSPNKMEAFAIPGPVTAVIAGFLVYFFSKVAFKSDKTLFALTLFFSGVLVSLISIFAYTGVLASIPQLPPVIKDPNFSPIGGKLPEVIFLLSLLPIGIFLAIDEKDKIKKTFYFLASAMVVLSAVLSINIMLPGRPGMPILADFRTSWSVTVDALKVSPFFGIGAANYLTAFTRFLPLSFNSTPLWANRFFSASSFALTLLTETGIFGFFAFALTVFTLLKTPFKHWKTFLASSDRKHVGYLLSLTVLTLAFILLPASLVLIVLFFLLAFLNSQDTEATVDLSAFGVKNGNAFVSKIPSFILALIIFIVVGLAGLFESKVVLGERHYKKAIDAILSNSAKTAYDELRAAITKNPSVDRYHATSDQLDLALARGLSQKKDLTDQERSTIAQLIQQTISEAKATVALNPQRAANWELLARTYQSIIPFAKGADEFTIVSFNQAIALDPISPNLRIALGGVYFSLGRFDDAVNSFGLAVTAKPDLANAHYNLALAYREKKDFDRAITEMNRVLALVKKDSSDYTVAKNELDNLQKKKAEVGGTSENLTAPQKALPPAIKPPLTLPGDSIPPATQ